MNMEKTDADEAQRIVDFIQGVMYALDGRIDQVSENIYLCAPNNMSVSRENFAAFPEAEAPAWDSQAPKAYVIFSKISELFYDLFVTEPEEEEYIDLREKTVKRRVPVWQARCLRGLSVRWMLSSSFPVLIVMPAVRWMPWKRTCSSCGSWQQCG